MEKPGRNDPCPCGSGRKFKKCHMGREDELLLRRMQSLPPDAGRRITSLPEVDYGRSREMADALDMVALTGRDVRIKFVDFDTYRSLGFLGAEPPKDTRGGGVLVNPKKTEKEDPNRIYVAVSRDVDGSTLIHQLAHVLDYLGGSRLLPGAGYELSLETQIPIEQLDHHKEFADRLDFLKDRFQVELDAEDAIVSYLNANGQLLDADTIKARDVSALLVRSQRMLRFMQEHREEIDALIRPRKGYLGDTLAKGAGR